MICRGRRFSSGRMAFLCPTAILFLFFVALLSTSTKDSQEAIPNRDVQLKADITAPSPSNSNKITNSFRILCYGDSLTAGMSPPNMKYSPYSTSLQTALNEISSQQHESSSSSPAIQFQVDHVGLPGWTTSQFLEILDQENGLRKLLQQTNETQEEKRPPVQLVIILAGTNDIPRLLRNSASDPEALDEAVHEGAGRLTTNLLKMHKVVRDEGVPQSVAIAIPSSKYQAAVNSAAQLVQQVNDNLRKHAKSNDESITFVPFPFSFEESGKNWSPDGLHFSPEGYHLLGRALAPVVQSLVTR